MTRESLVNENYDNKNALKFEEIVRNAEGDGALEISLQQYRELFDGTFLEPLRLLHSQLQMKLV